MKIKLKTCAGWDENSHPAFIWKNISNKPYCKTCLFKMGYFKPIKKITSKQIVKKEQAKKQTELRHQMFLNIWSTLTNKNCWSCGKYLGEEPLSTFFDHLLEKSKYPKFDLIKENIYICCSDCHTKKTNGNPTDNHKKAIEIAKEKFLK